MGTTRPPGPQGPFLLGHLPAFRRDPLAWLLEAATYGDVVRWRFGPFPIIQLNHPDPIREVLVQKAASFHKTKLSKQVFQESLGDGLVFSDGDLWRRQRRLIQPAFHSQRIDSYGRVMVDYTNDMLASWRPGNLVNVGRAVSELTLRIVAKTLFDADVSDEAYRVAEVMAVGQEMGNRQFRRLISLPRWLPTEENRERRRFVRTLDEIVLPIIDERRALGEDKGDLLSMLLLARDEQGTMSKRQVRDEAVTLFIAGHETTANALAWTWYLLSSHPEVEARLQAEVDAVLGGRRPEVGDLPRLPYTEQVVKESMRLYPPAWVLAREAIERVSVGGYEFKRGTVFFISPYALHRDGRVFEHPQRFDPDRFTPDREASLPRYAYLPFGGGPRICIGNAFALMEARLVLATMAQQVSLRMAASERVEPNPLITLRPKGEITMSVGARTGERMPAL